MKHTTTDRKHHISGVSSITSAELNINTEDLLDEDTLDDVDDKLIIGASILAKVISNQFTIERLTNTQKWYLSYFFYKRNYLVRRAINMKTKIPNSVFSIRKPNSMNDIIQDFVYSFFDNNLKQVDFKRVIFDVTLNMNIYGKGYVLIQTDYSLETDAILDLEQIKFKKQILSTEDKNKISEIVDRYNTDQDSVTYEEAIFVVNRVFPYLNHNFTGIKSMSIIDNFDINSIITNNEIGYSEIEIPASEFIINFIQNNNNLIYSKFGGDQDKYYDFCLKKLVKIGYSAEYVKMNIEAHLSGKSYINISNDVNDDVFFIEFRLDEEDPLANIYDELIQIEIAKLKNKKKMDLVDKKVKIVTSTDATPDEVALLVDDITNKVLENDISIIGTNYDISVQDIDVEIKSSLEGDDVDNIKDSIAAGLGVPMAIIDSSDTYSGSYISLQLLNSEMISFSEFLVEQIKSKLLNNIAMKKGFFEFDIFGNAKMMIPNVGMFKGSMLVSDTIDLLKDLIDDDNLPVSILLEQYLGIDYEDSIKEVAKEQKVKEEDGVN